KAGVARMAEYEPIEVRGIYRSSSHMTVWAVMQEAGVWDRVCIKLTSFVYIDGSAEAERLLLSGEIDFISGNHISTYTDFTKGRPIVHLTSPSNAVRDKLISREPMSHVSDLRGKRLGETSQIGADGGYSHTRGNHMLYVLKSGLQLSDVVWVDLAEKLSDEALESRIVSALQDGTIDAAMVTGGTTAYEQAGFHVLPMGELPMINGPTLTSTTPLLQRKDRLAERLVKAQLMGLQYAHIRPAECERILKRLSEGSSRTYRMDSLTKLARKPYPAIEAVANAWELACMTTPSTRDITPLTLWDLHYL